MKYYYTITYSGYVEEVPHDEEAAKPVIETIEDIRGVVFESFRPDLQVGVSIEYNFISVTKEK
jgi:hypothetical protein